MLGVVSINMKGFVDFFLVEGRATTLASKSLFIVDENSEPLNS